VIELVAGMDGKVRREHAGHFQSEVRLPAESTAESILYREGIKKP